MATNEYLPFGTAGGANVMSQASYAGLAARTGGFSTGVAASLQLNKAWRQASVVAAAWGTIVANAGINALDDGNVAALAANIITALNAELAVQTPVGIIALWGSDTAPAGWQICDGTLLDRTTYAALFAILGTTYGSTDGTNFRVPDARGLFIRGKDRGRGVDAARVLGSVQQYATAVPQSTNVEHLTATSGPLSLVSASNPSVIGFARAGKPGEAVTTVGVDASTPVPGETDLLNVCTGDSETRPINIALNFIIRIQ